MHPKSAGHISISAFALREEQLHSAATGEEPVPLVSLLGGKKQVQWSRKVPASVELMERRNVIGF